MQNLALQKDIVRQLEHVYGFVVQGDKLRKGECPQCQKRELWTDAQNPWVLRCPRLNKCGWEGHTKGLFPELFGRLNERYPVTGEHPNATADAYMQTHRGLNAGALQGSWRQGSFYSAHAVGRKGTATVLFEIAPHVTMERFVETIHIRDRDTGAVSARKQHFVGSHKGLWWNPPSQVLAPGDRVYIVEACIDALSLVSVGLKSVATLSAYNYPDQSLSTAPDGIVWIWALDGDKAGRRQAKKHASKMWADGYEIEVAIPPVGQREKDWNDLYQAGRLTADDMVEYHYQGRLLLAKSVLEKALVMYHHKAINDFQLEFGNRWYWFSLDLNKFNKQIEASSQAESAPEAAREKAAQQAATLYEIANCAIDFLYFQRNDITDESWYYACINFPHYGQPVKSTFTGGQISAPGEFKKRLVSIAPGAIFTGSSRELDKIMGQKIYGIKSVSTVDFIGYSKRHDCYVFGNKAVAAGRIYEVNEEDYFQIGKTAIKTLDKGLSLNISTAAKYNAAWVNLLWECHGAKGLIGLGFWFGSLFAEQIRATQESFPFLELIGQAGAGKSTLIEFFWRLLGRTEWEGFDPSKNTAANRARNFLQVSGMPVVLLEADREEDIAHSRKFDWEELKPMFNGRGVRGRAMKTTGNETYEPPFRGAIVITQNAEVQASEAILSRIVHIELTREHHNAETKAAADKLNLMETEELSYFLLLACMNESQVMATLAENYKRYENAILQTREVKTVRIAKNHAQMMALMDAMGELLDIPQGRITACQTVLAEMAESRQKAIAADHPLVAQFWESYYYLNSRLAGSNDMIERSLNHSRDPQIIAIRIAEYVEIAAEHRQPVPFVKDVKKYLKGSRTHKFLDVKVVNSRQCGKSVRCWCFQIPSENSYGE